MESYGDEENVSVLLPNVSTVSILTQKLNPTLQQLPDLATIGGIQLSDADGGHLLSQSEEPGTSQQIIVSTSADIKFIKKEGTTKKRNSLTIEKKIEIIQRHEKGETQRALSLEYNVSNNSALINRECIISSFSGW